MDINIYGGLSLGLRHFCLLTDHGQDWFPITAARSLDTLAFAMRSRDIPVGDPADQRALLQRIRDLKDFPPADIVGASGWRGTAYVLPTGTVIVPDGVNAPQIAFPRSNSLQRLGVRSKWKNRVAAAMAGRPIGTFALMLAFLPPLLRFMPLVPNAVFELVGPPGSGKATLRNAVSSIFGGTGANGTQHYWRSIETVIDKLDDAIQPERDRLVILDGTHVLAHLVDARRLGKPYVTLAFNIARGDLAAKDAAPGSPGYRGGVLLLGRESMRTLAGKDTVGEDELITLHIPPNWEVVPEGRDRAAFSEALMTAASANHGHAFQRFIEALVKEVATDERGLITRLRAWQDEFLSKAGADRNIGSDHIRARIFAGVFAAGMLAKEYRILPQAFACGSDILKCYEIYRAHNRPRKAFAERLDELIARGDIVAVSGDNDDRQAKRALAAIGTVVQTPTHREVRIPPENIGRAFSDWKTILKSDEVEGVLIKGDGRSLKPKARLAPGLPAKRCWCFKRPLGEESLFTDPLSAEGD